MCDVCDHLLLMLDTRKSLVVNAVAIIWLYCMDVGCTSCTMSRMLDQSITETISCSHWT